MNSRHAFLVASALMSLPLTARGSIIWSAGPNDITFSKAASADFTLAANQDRIESNVWITRGATQGIYNIRTESAYTHDSSPQGTAWAFSSLDGNPTFAYGTGAANHASLIFSNWETASQGGGHSFPGDLTNNAAVLHLLADDIYIDLQFTNWGAISGGAFAYTRAVPEPATLSLLALGGLALIRRRK